MIPVFKYSCKTISHNMILNGKKLSCWIWSALFANASLHTIGRRFLSGRWSDIPDSMVHGANMGPIWGWQDPGGPRVALRNLAIWDVYLWLCAHVSGIIALGTITLVAITDTITHILHHLIKSLQLRDWVDSMTSSKLRCLLQWQMTSKGVSPVIYTPRQK